MAFAIFGCVFLFAFSANTLTAATIFVDPPPASIQTAIDSASSGDTIQLSAGTYVQEVQVISKSLNIVGAGEDVTIIQAFDPSIHLTQNFIYSGINFWCVLMVDNQAAPTTQTVNISNLTVDGGTQQDTTVNPFYGNGNRFFAIGYHNAGGTVQDVHTTNTRQTSNFNELAGGGIVNASDTGTVSFDILNCLVDFYQRSGIDCRGPALTATVSNNTVNRGYVLTPDTSTAAPNGIQFSGATVGSITNNIVESNISTVANAASSGIIPFGAGPNLVVSGNTLNNNDAGIAAIENGDNLTVSNNTVNFTMTPGTDNPPEGIILQDTAGLTTVSSNIMNNISFIDMEIIDDTGSNNPYQLMDNQFNGSQTGLQITGITTSGPIVTMNSDSFTGTSGYYIKEITAPNNIWPSTATVSFDGLVSGHITLAEYNAILAKLYGNLDDPSNGILLEYITPTPPTLTALSTNAGPTTGGSTITITGTSFISSDTMVFFGSVPGTNVVILSDDTLTVTVPPGAQGIVDVTVSTPFGVTPIVSAGDYTYVLNAPLPPTNFTGVIKKNKFLNATELVLKTKWNPSSSSCVIAYRIYYNGTLVTEVSVDSPLVFTTCLDSIAQAKQYQIVSVNCTGIESAPSNIRIING